MTDRLEEEIAHMSRALEDMHEMLLDQGKRLEVMERRVTLLMARAAEAEADEGSGVVLGDERPPHY